MVEILLVEDDPGGVRLTIDALRAAKVRNRVQIARDGLEATRILHREGEHGDALRPDLILLDHTLPSEDGRQVLEGIKGDPALRSIPVVVLTTSQSEEEEDNCHSYALYARCCVTKPMGLDQVVEVVKSIEDFWFTIVKLPPEGL